MGWFTIHLATCVRSVPRGNTNIQGQIIYQGTISSLSRLQSIARLLADQSNHRHVRVNHIDKDVNDPQLKEVLSQRSDRGERRRRRRPDTYGTLKAPPPGYS